MTKETCRKVEYTMPLINARGDVYGETEERTGWFIGFRNDYRQAVIETKYGEIVFVDSDKLRFMEVKE